MIKIYLPAVVVKPSVAEVVYARWSLYKVDLRSFASEVKAKWYLLCHEKFTRTKHGIFHLVVVVKQRSRITGDFSLV